MRRTFVLLITIGCLISLLAGAALADTNCDGGEFCIYGGESYSQTGGFWDPTNDDPDWPCCGTAGVQNDDDSVNSNTPGRDRVYQSNSYVNFIYCVPAGFAYPVINSSRDNTGNSHLEDVTTGCGTLALPTDNL